MAKKTVSKFHKTIFPHDDVEDFVFSHDEFSAPTFPERLANPIKMDMWYLARLMNEANFDPVSSLQAWTTTMATQRGELRSRWLELFSFYKIEDSPSFTPEKAWRQLAIGLANDFVPGLRVENVFPTDETIEEEGRVIQFVIEVSKRLKERREKTSGHVPESESLQYDFFQKWDKSYGEKPTNFGAFKTQFSREKEKFARLLIERGHSGPGAIRAFERLGLIAPEFLTTLPPSLSEHYLDKLIAKAKD